VQTLQGLQLDTTLPMNYISGSYLTGGADTQFDAQSCGSFSTSSATAAEAIVTPDRKAMLLSTADDLLMDYGSPQTTVSVVPLLDNEPYPEEGIEYTVWGSNDPDAVFPIGWQLATLITIYNQGFTDDPSCTSTETDDFAGLYTFGLESFRYVRVRANSSITLFSDPSHTTWSSTEDNGGEPGWQSDEAELDSVVAMVCDTPPVANAGPDLLGLVGDTMLFDASQSQGNIQIYGWDIDGDKTIDLTGANPQWSFASEFDRDVTLMVVNDQGCVGTDQVRVTVGLDIPKPDLTVTFVNSAELSTDIQSLQSTGTVKVTVANVGNAPAFQPANIIVFDDSNNDEKFDPSVDTVLGTTLIPAGLERNASRTFSIPISGVVSFRGNRVFAFVDSENQVIEQNETNNINLGYGQCESSNQSCIIIQDDFNDGDDMGWTNVRSPNGSLGSWQVVNGEYVTNFGGGVWNGDTVWTDYTAQVDLRFPSGAYNDAGLLFRYQDPDNWYQFRIQNGLIRIVSIIDGQVNASLRADSISINTDTWYTLKVVVVGDRVKAYIDGSLVFDYTGLQLSYGAAGMMTDGVLVHYDNFVVHRCGLSTPEGVHELLKPFVLNEWSAQAIPGTGVTDLPWSVDSTEGLVTHTNGSSSSVFVSDTTQNNLHLRGSFYVDNDVDDQQLGLVFGFQDTARHYRFTWENGQLSGTPGMRLSVINSDNVANPYADATTLFSNGLPWQPFTLYNYELSHFDGLINITISRLGEILESISIFDDRFTSGKFGFYNQALSGVEYTGSDVLTFDYSQPDLSVSLLEISSTTQTIRARVGNGGGLSSPDGVLVSFYEGDPDTDGTVIDTVFLPSLAPGAYQDVSISLPILSGNADIVVVADAGSTLTECNESNNRASLPVLPQITTASLLINTDAPAYGSNDAVLLQATISNPGALPGEFEVIFQIEDNQGNVITTFGPINTGVIVGNGTTTLNESWATDSFLAGTYLLRGIIYGLGGSELNSATSSFDILAAPVDDPSSPIASLRITTDQARYHIDSLVNITGLINNLASNASIDNASISLIVTDPAGIILTSETIQLNQLVAGALRETSAPIILQNARAGSYTVQGALRVANVVLATGSTAFTVVENRLISLEGFVVAEYEEIEISSPQQCTDTLSNNSATPIIGLSVRKIVVDIANGIEIVREELLLDIAANQDQINIRSLSTTGLFAGNYACVLQAEVNGQFETFGYAAFKVLDTQTPPPVQIDTTLESDDGLRLLVLLDASTACHGDQHEEDDNHKHKKHKQKYNHKYGHKHKHHKPHHNCTRTDGEPHGPKNAPLLTTQSRKLANLLAEQNVSYTLVTKADAFTRELRSGSYTAYALFAEHVKLKKLVLQELREAVYRGEGLLVAGLHNHRYNKLDEVLGIKIKGQLAAPSIVAITGSDLYADGNAAFSLTDKVSRLTLKGAEIVALYPDISDCKNDDDPHHKAHNKKHHKKKKHHSACQNKAIAVTRHAFGQGRSVTIGFDLLLQMTTDNADPRLVQLLAEALSDIQPSHRDSLVQTPALIRLNLSNVGLTTPGRALITLPLDSLVLDAGLAQQQLDGSLIWPFILNEGETQTLDLWLQLPPQAGPAPNRH